jgi:small subunit ribosomal protein S15
MKTKEQKQEIAKKFAKHPTDSGSTAVQVALLTDRITTLSAHLKSNKKDYSTQLGLLRMVGQRRRLLNYLKKSDLDTYNNVKKALDLRK